MIKISRKTEYGLVALQYLANRAANRVSSVKEISDKYQISHDLLAKILQSLRGRDLVVSVQGHRGGYKLKKPPEDITLLNVIESLEGPIGIVSCLSPKGCQNQDDCCLMSGLSTVNQKLIEFFTQTTLASLAKESANEQPKVQPDKPVYI